MLIKINEHTLSMNRQNNTHFPNCTNTTKKFTENLKNRIREEICKSSTEFSITIKVFHSDKRYQNAFNDT